MPKRTDIKTILLIGSGPIVIGQACEFDYSGTQAAKTLKELGYRVVLINSNPATIMTDPEFAHRTYIEPITPEIISKIIKKESVDAILPTMGGQTALNVAMDMYEQGMLEGVEFLGANPEAIKKGEDRQEFKEAMIKVGMDLLAWSGASKKNQLIYGATLGFAFLTTIEIFDGFSEEWGFSPGDVLANALGTSLLIGQELLWNEQRIQYKFSFHTTDFPQYYPEKLGENTLQQIIKDYNGQTYWLSVNIWSFFKESRIPRWLNVAVGYGSEGLPEIHPTPYNYPGMEPYPTFRQFYASIDVDLTKIRTKSPFLKTIFNVFNYLKIPAPTLEITGKGKFIFHPVYF